MNCVDSSSFMHRALKLAYRGEGLVEPNPMVGAVLVKEPGEIVAEGFHERFGGPHAEVNAIKLAGTIAKHCTLFVTLEPCCHVGKTGSCSQAIIQAGIRSVVVGTLDPSKKNRGKGILELRNAGVDVEIGTLEPEAKNLIAPFQKLHVERRPWIHLKWAMSLDGKIATHTGDSRWISNEKSREVVHQLRGRMDAILIGANTARMDDPLLTARPSGPRLATRIVIDPTASLDVNSQLVRTIIHAPLMVVVAESTDPKKTQHLKEKGAEVFSCPFDEEKDPHRLQLDELFEELGSREMTNVLVEGGGTLGGYLHDHKMVDEVHTFISPKLVGGEDAPTPISGAGVSLVSEAVSLTGIQIETLDGDLYLRGRIVSDKKALQ